MQIGMEYGTEYRMTEHALKTIFQGTYDLAGFRFPTKFFMCLQSLMAIRRLAGFVFSGSRPRPVIEGRTTANY